MANTYTNLVYHITFSTKNRLPYITNKVEDDLHAYMVGIVKHVGGTRLAINGMPDHVHLLLRLPPAKGLSVVMRDIKANSSKWFNQNHSGFRKFGWQDGYAAFTVSESQIEGVRRYIQKQKEHHRKMDFAAELRILLKKHRIEYDEQYLLD